MSNKKPSIENMSHDELNNQKQAFYYRLSSSKTLVNNNFKIFNMLTETSIFKLNWHNLIRDQNTDTIILLLNHIENYNIPMFERIIQRELRVNTTFLNYIISNRSYEEFIKLFNFFKDNICDMSGLYISRNIVKEILSKKEITYETRVKILYTVFKTDSTYSYALFHYECELLFKDYDPINNKLNPYQQPENYMILKTPFIPMDLSVYNNLHADIFILIYVYYILYGIISLDELNDSPYLSIYSRDIVRYIINNICDNIGVGIESMTIIKTSQQYSGRIYIINNENNNLYEISLDLKQQKSNTCLVNKLDIADIDILIESTVSDLTKPVITLDFENYYEKIAETKAILVDQYEFLIKIKGDIYDKQYQNKQPDRTPLF